MTDQVVNKAQQIAILTGLLLSVLTFSVFFVRIPWVFYGFTPWLLPVLTIISPIGHLALTFLSYVAVIISAMIFRWRGVPLAFALGLSTGVVATSWLERAILPPRIDVNRIESGVAES